MDMKLEVVVLPVSDVNRAKQFYTALGWREDIDLVASADFRVVQFTPPDSGCAIVFGDGLTSATPGSLPALLLVVGDIAAARVELVERGAAVSEVFHGARARFHLADTSRRAPGLVPERRSYQSFASFSDPDGNDWVLQEVQQRLPGR